MKKIVYITLALFFTSSTFAASNISYQIFNVKKNTYENLIVQKYQELRLTKDCFKAGKTPSCDAYKASLTKKKPSPPMIEFAGHPGARYCIDQGGLNRIVIDKEKKQYDYCLFKDNSMVDSWDLYFKHYPPKQIK